MRFGESYFRHWSTLIAEASRKRGYKRCHEKKTKARPFVYQISVIGLVDICAISDRRALDY